MIEEILEIEIEIEIEVMIEEMEEEGIGYINIFYHDKI